jgi:hypothetical protein
VTDADTGLPIGGVRVRAFLGGDPASGSPDVTTYTCATGEYALAFTALVPTRVALSFNAAGYEPKTSVVAVGGPKNGDGDEELELKSDLPGTLTGLVTDATTTLGVEGAQVKATLTGTTTTTYTIATGDYSIPGLESGTYSITVSKTGYGSSFGTAFVPSGGSASANFSLTPGGGGGGGGCAGAITPTPSKGGDMALLAALPFLLWLAVFLFRRRSPRLVGLSGSRA